ncbi:uncharacterized protein LOC110732292 [Chenopodium quinoa]|uniref:uncharacterized protein LOC110732292 n=1 Tax=Chenopodium quinoa TaxID=63459 RepID=UPI000B78A501|nr:uncharacterized protein LOC110732292 [Chenopodium quinoa]
MINLQKSYVRFSANAPEDYRDYLSTTLRLQARSSNGDYLGLLVDLGRRKCKDFQFMVDRVTQRLSSFASLHLSSTAKFVIINSVLVASFNHILSVFKAPSTICDRIDSLFSRYWWQSGKDSKGLALAFAMTVHLPKVLGRLGISHFHSFNLSLLAKQTWRLIHHPQLLVSHVHKAKCPSLLSARPIMTALRPSWGSRVVFRPSILEDDRPTFVSELLFPGSSSCIPIDPTCIFCHRNSELVEHLFRDCQFTKKLRDNFNRDQLLSASPSTPFHLWFEDLVSLVGFFGLCWAIWLTSNNVRDSHTAGMGWCFRDPSSPIYIARGARACTASSALQSELLTCLWGLRHALHRGVSQLLLCTDCMSVPHLLVDHGSTNISIMWILGNIRNVISSFSLCHIQKVSRSSVAVAHRLASAANRKELLCYVF